MIRIGLCKPNFCSLFDVFFSLKRYRYDRLYVVWASMADKSYETMLNDVARVADMLLLTRLVQLGASKPAVSYIIKQVIEFLCYVILLFIALNQGRFR